jgi:uncharacterized membrane protein
MNAHLFVIHFPVTLVIVATALDLIGVGMNDRALRDWASRFLLVTAIAVFLAFATGEGALLAALSGGGAVDAGRIESHQEWGSVGVWVIIGSALLRTLWRNRLSGPFAWVNLGLLLGSTGLLVAITVSGMAVRHVP